MHANPRTALREQGLTLIEMMVAMVLGLVVTGVTIGVFVHASRNFTQDEGIGRMQENAGYALRMLSEDLSLSAFWGEEPNVWIYDYEERLAAERGIAVTPTYATWRAGLTLSGTDCGTNWALSPTPFVQVLDNATSSEINSAFPCVLASEAADRSGSGRYPTDTDVLAIKHVAGKAKPADRVDPSDDNKIFMRTGGSASLAQYDHTSPGPSGELDWEVLAHVYYISNNSFKDSFAGVAGGDGCREDATPALYRKKLQNLSAADPCSSKVGLVMDDDRGGVAPGIEYFHIMWGADTDLDGTPDRYQSTWTRDAVTAQVHLLARTTTPDCGYEHTRSHTLGDVTLPASRFVVPNSVPTGVDASYYCGRPAGDPDPFHRRVFTTTVRMRNHANLNRLYAQFRTPMDN